MKKKIEKFEPLVSFMLKTNQRLESIEQRMVTKEDIKNMASKDDIKNMATKDDIKNMATKDDIKNMATKDDIKEMATKTDISRIALVLDKHGREIQYLKENSATKSDVNLILNRIDDFAIEIRNYGRKELVHDFRLKELESLTDLHGKRLTALEGKRD